VRTLGPTIRAATVEEAVAPEIVVIAIPWARVPEMLERVPDWEGRIIIDATNPLSLRDASSLERDDRSSSERIVKLAPGAHVVMAFNTLSATVLARPPAEAGGRRVIFYSGDHGRAKRKVAALISGLGFAAVDLGSLEVGGRLQQSPGGALAMLNLVQLPAT
jgi:8-hydroxy-5-deazaflavin:NADPH oxidoreductase